MPFQMNQSIYATFFEMVLDYLPIQASAVPCERAFSSGTETLTAHLNRIKPPLMEALQMLEYSLKKCCLDFMAGWATEESSLAEAEPGPAEGPLASFLEEKDGAMESVIEILAEDNL